MNNSQFKNFKSRTRHRNSINCRRSQAASVIELTVGAFMFATFSAISVDLAICIAASGVNNQACRDAARAAGLARPTEARSAANASLKVHQKVDGDFIKELKITKFTYNGSAPYGSADSQDPANQPMVSVSSQITVELPAPVFLFGSEFAVRNGKLSFISSYQYPILNTDITLPKGQFDPDHAGFILGQQPVVSSPCDDAPPTCPEPKVPTPPIVPPQPPLPADPPDLG